MLGFPPMKALRTLFLPALFAATPAFAHHSFSMFDRVTVMKIAGTVKQFELVNPHGWLQIMVEGPSGKINNWTFELGGPNAVSHMGLTPSSLQPGDKVTISYHPL